MANRPIRPNSPQMAGAEGLSQAILVLAAIALFCWFFYPYVVGPFVMKMPFEGEYEVVDLQCEMKRRPSTTDVQEYAQNFSVWTCERFARRNYVADLISKHGKRQ